MAATTPSDSDLLRAVRDGDRSAFTELYLRHRPAALHLARSYRVGGDPEDLVSDAFARVLGAIRRGGGPEDSFRPYLYVTLRRLALERCQRARREDLVPVPETVIDVTDGPGIDGAERELVAAAFADLPERWQTVLWQTAVEGRAPRDVARDTGMEANTVAVLAHRARERLREAYLQAHVGPACDAHCRPHRGRLGAYVRGGLSRRQQAAARDHVATCDACRQLVIELDDVNRLLARAVLPVFALAARDGVLGPDAVAALGGAAATSAASATGSTAIGAAGGAGAAVASGAGAGLGLGAVAKVGAVLTAVAVVGAAAVSPVLVGGDDPPATVQIAAPSSSDDAGRGTSSTSGGAAPPQGTTDTPAPTDGGGPGTSAEASGDTLGVEAGVDADLGDVGVRAGADVTAGVGQDGLGAGAGVDVGLGPHDVDVDATVRAGPGDGVAVDATWTVDTVGRGTLDLEVVNPTTETLTAVDARVDLSPRARTASLLGGCEPTDPSLLGAVLALVGALTCGLGDIAAQDGASASLALTVAGPDETASVTVVTGGRVIARAEVPLTP